ncbi:hypothetical protein GCM10010423_75940 [Streptomyces levis]|uniref:Uncharacterized protein n=1 Tax=Streptomyces levis TaxID=285566 RepID=A0ABP6BEU6_9ACTN
MFLAIGGLTGWGTPPRLGRRGAVVSGPRIRKASDTSAYASPRRCLVADLSHIRRKDVAYATVLSVEHVPARPAGSRSGR